MILLIVVSKIRNGPHQVLQQYYDIFLKNLNSLSENGPL